MKLQSGQCTNEYTDKRHINDITSKFNSITESNDEMKIPEYR